VSNPTLPTSGAVALVPFLGETVNFLSGTLPNITSLDYVILAPGDFVELSQTNTGWTIVG
jgi:hypothetical protein